MKKVKRLTGRIPTAIKRHKLASLLGLAVVMVLVGWCAWSVSKISSNRQMARLIHEPDSCVQIQNRIKCYSHELIDITKQYNAKVALARLDQLRQHDEWVATKCHELAHDLGRDAIVYYKDVNKASSMGSNLCASGYFHGVMEQYMANYNDTDLLAITPKLCKPGFLKPRSYGYFTCLHGLGHGLAIHFDNDLSQAKPYCDSMPEWEAGMCITGMFMQYFITDSHFHLTEHHKVDDPLYPCNEVAKVDKSACYSVVAEHLLRIYNNDLLKSFATCDKAEDEFKEHCYYGVGRLISDQVLFDPNKTVAGCALGMSNLQWACYDGAAQNVVFHDQKKSAANSLCAAVPENIRYLCYVSRDRAASTF